MQAPQPHSPHTQILVGTPLQQVPSPPAVPVAETLPEHLLQAIAAGDEAAMARLYDTTSPVNYGLALRILGDPSAAEEVTLEVYLQVWNQAALYDAERGTPITWLCTITRSRALDRRRMHARHQQRQWPLDVAAQLPDAAPTPAEMTLIQQQHTWVQEALQQLPPEQREVIELAYFAGLSQRDMATLLGQPLGTVKTRIRLGMCHLRDHLLPLVEDSV